MAGREILSEEDLIQFLRKSISIAEKVKARHPFECRAVIGGERGT
jgi:hypothetical protein